MDGAILLIAADDGIMPQSREHIMLAKQVGVKKMVVFINKADLVDEEMLELVEMEAHELLEQFGYDAEETPIVKGSAMLALQGDATSEYGVASIGRLLDALDSHIDVPVRDTQAPLIMPIDNVLSVQGRGTIVVGTVKQGRIRKKDSLEIVGHGHQGKASVANMQIFHQDVNEALAGDNVGVNIKGPKKDDLSRGMLLVTPGSITPTNHFEGTCYFLSRFGGFLYICNLSSTCVAKISGITIHARLRSQNTSFISLAVRVVGRGQSCPGTSRSCSRRRGTRRSG